VPRQVGYFASPLGAFKAGGWRPEAVALEPGDQLILYTDGVIDTVGESSRFGEERLADVLAGAAGADDAVRRIDQALKAFAHGPQADDTAVLAVERVATVTVEPGASTADDEFQTASRTP
jgi:serine phosphatase RsbU (regulator of sigma subunit)